MPRGMVIALAACLLAAGCGDDDAGLPAACTEGPEAVRSALARAPAEVRVEGTPLSECMNPDADGADLQNVGLAYVETAAALAPEARKDPQGQSALQLGYLVGAAHRGGDKTQGFHTELLRRLDQEAAAAREASPAFRRGEAAGRRSG